MRRLVALALAFAALPAFAQTAPVELASTGTAAVASVGTAAVASVGTAADRPPPAVAGRDQTVAWRTYAAAREARVRTFPCDDERRPLTVVIDDRASNGAPITDEAAFVADVVARELGFDPTMATYVFRFTPAAFASGADERGKTLLLRATFSRLDSGNLGSPQWRVLTPDALDELTDRALR